MNMPPVQRVSPGELRRIFNKEILPRIARNELLEIIVTDREPSERAHQAAGTRSQIVEYIEARGGRIVKVALIHRYLRPDGSLGGSGLPDPKRISHDGTVFAVRKDDPAA
jgi:hypothetical protein